MMPSPLVITGLLLCAALLWLTPALSRPGLFFGVTVSPHFRDTDAARSGLRRYRSLIAISTVFVCVVLVVVPPRPGYAAAALLQVIAGYGAWIWARREVLPHARRTDDVRRAAIQPRDVRLPGGVMALAGPFLIVAAAALFVYTQWDAIPDQIRSLQRGSSGRMVAKSATTVFGPFAFTTALLVAFTLQTVMLVRRTRQIAPTGAAAVAESTFKRRSAWQSIGATYLLAIGSSWFVIRGLRIGPRGGLSAPTDSAIILVMVAATCAFVVWATRVGQGGQRPVPVSAETPSGDATPDSAWIGGVLYFNPSDPAVFVETRFGFGWSLNFGNAWSWVFLACAVGVPLLIQRLMRGF